MPKTPFTPLQSQPIKDCVGITKRSDTRYELRDGLELELSPTSETSYVKIVGKTSGSSNHWSGKHVGKYLAGYTSYGTGTGLQNYRVAKP